MITRMNQKCGGGYSWLWIVGWDGWMVAFREEGGEFFVGVKV